MTNIIEPKRPWFDVDHGGLSKIMARRRPEWVIGELIQNAWDAPGATTVEVDLTPIPGRPLATIAIEDDSPVGFVDLSHAYTLFADSAKKTDPNLRGRFNVGEKTVLALCEEAEIATTTGTIRFTPEGREVHSRRRRAAGTLFSATIRLTRDELETVRKAARSFISPNGIETVVNGEPLERHAPLCSFACTLKTDVAGEDGILRRRTREATVRIYKPLAGMPPRLYELGIPVVEIEHSFDLDIGQKVPLTLERDAVSPSYLRDLNALVLAHAIDFVPRDQASSSWVRDAIASPEIDDDTVRKAITRAYGDKVVVADPSDRQATYKAVSKGYIVIGGGAFTSDQWDNIRRSGVAPPAGQVFPSDPSLGGSGDAGGDVERTAAMMAFERFTKVFARRLLDRAISVRFRKDFDWTACYGRGELSFNVTKLGKRWFEGPLRADHIDLLIHEFGHEFESNHLSDRYYRVLTKLGGQATMLAIEERKIFDLSRYNQTSS